jgi:hypothetical protein
MPPAPSSAPLGMEWIVSPSSADGDPYVLVPKRYVQVTHNEVSEMVEETMRPEGGPPPQPDAVRNSGAKPEDRPNGP